MRDGGNTVYGLIKPSVDAHTLGIHAVSELLLQSRYQVVHAGDHVAEALSLCEHEIKRQQVLDWIKENKIARLGISYRLDEDDALHLVGYLVEALKRERLFDFQGGPLDLLFFAGLPAACQAIEKAHQGLVVTFKGGESPGETLVKMGVPPDRIPVELQESSRYDQARLEFGKMLIDDQSYTGYQAPDRSRYPEYGSREDTVIKRLDANRSPRFEPLIRAHVGPYSSSVPRQESVAEFVRWVKELAQGALLDILSIGSSQLTQSNFGEDWEDKPNGGGVPVNSSDEYRMIYEASRPMLVRTYAGTKNIPQLARMHEQSMNICWHALSFWWFNLLDGRGPYDVYTNLKEHIETLAFIAETNKPFEANVPHHFAFRGADDVTYVVSAYLAARLAKQKGIKTFILQNMLNTPRITWGIQDLAKSRALLEVVRTLEDQDFRVLLQPRAGLDYFKPDLYEARIQLASVTALMDDIEPYDQASPSIIHVVSYSEALHLATPAVIEESIRITQCALNRYRDLRRKGDVDDMGRHDSVRERTAELVQSARKVIDAIERSVPDPYSAEGFYTLFVAGFLPLPYLWGDQEEFKYTKDWVTRPVKGGILLMDDQGLQPMSTGERIARAQGHLDHARFLLGQRMAGS